MIEEKIYTQEEKTHTQKEIRRLLMKIMAEKKKTEVPPHPKQITDIFVIRRYYAAIIQRAAEKALEENKVDPEKNKGSKPYLYSLTDIDIILDYIEKEYKSGKEASAGFAEIGFGMDEIDLLRVHFKSLRSPH